jgi:hypothetical protein
VLVLDPTLIPISVDVVIGDNVYELHFKVEPEEMSDKPLLLEMDEDGKDEDKMDEENGGSSVQGDLMLEDKNNAPTKEVSGPSLAQNNSSQHGGSKTVATDQLALDDFFGEEDDMLFYGEDDEVGDMLESGDRPDDKVMDVVKASVLVPANRMVDAQRELAAIPEADTPSRKSKRRAKSVDKHSLERAERMKASRNLDLDSGNGTNSKPNLSFIHYSKEHVIDNLSGVGISLGNNVEQLSSAVERIKEVELGRIIEATKNDMTSDVFDKEEKEELEREEVDRLILNSLCCEIMDEVMDLGNAYL